MIPEMKFGGWAQKYLETMLNGLTGHLHELFYPFNTDCWLKPSFQDGGLEGWWPYEQVAYWLDGYVKCAYLAGDKKHFERAKGMIYAALEVVDESGFVGAKELKERGQGNQWVHAVFFRAVLFLYEATGDKKYLDSVVNHYLSGTNDYSEWRESVNIENMITAYRLGGDERMKELAVKAYDMHSQNESNAETKLADFFKDSPIELHAVTYDEMVKIPAMIYSVTGDKRYLEATVKGLERIKKFHMLPIGIHSGSEGFAGTDALSGVETCDITDYCRALKITADITGDTGYLDSIESIMYNVAPSVMDEEFKTLQYFSSMNQVISTFNSNHSGSFTQTPRMAYQADHYPECCTGNCNRSMPEFLLRAFSATDTGYKFDFYIPGEYRAGDGKFTVETEYPYGERVKITYLGSNLNTEVKFRVPGWCEDFKFSVRQSAERKGSVLSVKGEFNSGDEIVLILGSKLEVVDTGEGLMVRKQPVVYTLKIEPHIEIDTGEKRQTKGYPAYNITPASVWQIAIDREEFLSSAKLSGGGCDLLKNGRKITSTGYYMKGAELKRIHSSKVPISDYDKREIVKLRAMGQVIYDGEMLFTPAIKDIKPLSLEKTGITLVPYSTATLRWTVFPDAKKYM